MCSEEASAQRRACAGCVTRHRLNRVVFHPRAAALQTCSRNAPVQAADSQRREPVHARYGSRRQHDPCATALRCTNEVLPKPRLRLSRCTSLFTKFPTFVPPHYLVKLHVCECPGGDNGKVDPAMQDFFAKLRHGALSRALDDEIRAWCFTQSLDIRHYLDAGGKL